jgi:hypothetical protein
MDEEKREINEKVNNRYPESGSLICDKFRAEVAQLITAG